MNSIVTDKSKQALADSISAVISSRDIPSRDGCDLEPTPRMIEAFEQFNRGLYWEQHETLEGIWRSESDPSIRNLYKGVIQVGVGFHHLTRGNYIGLMKVLARGITYLKPYVPECLGVDVARLRHEASEIYMRAKALGPERIGEIGVAELPKIHYRVNGVWL